MGLREIEFLLKDKEKTVGHLFYSGYCKETCHASGICPIAERSKYYKNEFGTTVFEVKNMTREKMTCDCKERVKQYDITITEIFDEQN